MPGVIDVPCNTFVRGVSKEISLCPNKFNKTGNFILTLVLMIIRRAIGKNNLIDAYVTISAFQ